MIQKTKHSKKDLDNIKNKYKAIKVMQLTFAIIAMALAYFAMPAAAETNLIANWTFNEDTGAVAADSSGNGNNVALINGPTWTTGVNGNALQFDGTNDYAVNTSATNIPAKSPFSIVAWVNGKSFSNPKWSDIVRKEGSWAVQINPNNKLNFEITEIQDTISDIDVPTNVWTHIAVTLEGTTVKFYKNGVLGDTRTQTNVPNAGLNTIDIGGYTSWGTYLNGMLDDVKIYNRILNASEINDDYLASSMSTIHASAPTSLLLPQATPEPTPAPTQAPAPTSTPIPITSGKLLFDGSFKSTDKWTSINGRFGAYNDSCLVRSDSLVVVPAPRRQGIYAGKFTVKNGDTCNSADLNERAQIQQYNPELGIGVTVKDVWYGYSEMFDPTWEGQTEGWNVFQSASSYHYHLADTGEFATMMSSQSDTINRILYFELNPTMKGTRTPYKMISGYEKGIWHDWLWHIKWAQDTTGFVEIYHKKEGESSYTLLFSKYNIQTKKIIPGYPNDPEIAKYGIYRPKEYTNTQIQYYTGIKIGTTRESVTT